MRLTAPRGTADERLGRTAEGGASRTDSRHDWLVVPACASRLTLRSGSWSSGPLAPRWTERRFALPPDQEGFDAELSPPNDDPFAGFLAAIDAAPDGLWQDVRWERAGSVTFAARPALRWSAGGLVLHGALATIDEAGAGPSGSGEVDARRVEVFVDGRAAAPDAGPATWRVEADGDPPPPWQPDEPELRTAHVEIRLDGAASASLDVPIVRHSLRADGERLLLNGRPFRVQGLLHWGYYPGLRGPDPEPADVRAELLEMKRRGFNLLKACLWIPPHRFLDVCDEVGMAVWVEYPLWARSLPGRADDAARDLARAAYRDFVLHDACHPCVVLRTLTCENDDVDAETAREVRRHIATVAPGGLANDNSGWIDHSRDPDFWDEHPYLNASQWPAYVERTRRVLDARPPKPLILGETMAFDSLDDEASRAAAVRLRRRQVEGLRTAFPDAGYVMCAARDIPQAPLGLQDRDGVWKTPLSDWRWQVEPAAPLPASPRTQRAVAIPAGVTLADRLDDATLDRCRGGARIFHAPSLVNRAWRCPEHTFWSPVASWDALLADDVVPHRDLLFDDLLSGRALAPPDADGCRILVAARDVHDRADGGRLQPFVLAARIGEGMVLVSALRTDNDAGVTFHDALLERFAEDGERWLAGVPELVIADPPRSLFLDGPWTLRGDGVRAGEQTVRPGTMLENDGRNAVQSWVDATATVSIPADWSGPVLLRAEAIGDGFELWIDETLVHTHGRPGFTWDAGRDVPALIDVSEHVRPGESRPWRIRTKDHRGAGALVGPLYLCDDDPTRSLLY